MDTFGLFHFPNSINPSGRAVHTSKTTTNNNSCPGELRRTLFTCRMTTRCYRACCGWSCGPLADRPWTTSVQTQIFQVAKTTCDYVYLLGFVLADLDDPREVIRASDGPTSAFHCPTAEVRQKLNMDGLSIRTMTLVSSPIENKPIVRGVLESSSGSLQHLRIRVLTMRGNHATTIHSPSIEISAVISTGSTRLGECEP